MVTAKQYHRWAMDVTDIALDMKRNGLPHAAKRLLVIAEVLERQAADMTDTEPAKSILTDSAKELYRHIKDLSTATDDE